MIASAPTPTTGTDYTDAQRRELVMRLRDEFVAVTESGDQWDDLADGWRILNESAAVCDTWTARKLFKEAKAYAGDYLADAARVNRLAGSTAGAEPFREIGAAELVSADMPPIKSWPVFGRDHLVVRGWAHLVSAGPKVGKTTFLAEMLREWDNAGGSVLWATEEPQSVWQRRLARLDSEPAGLRLIFGNATHAEAILERAVTGAEDIVIVDTVRGFIPMENENDNSERARVIRPWIDAVSRQAGKTLVLVVHARKGGGDHGEAIAGGHELLAAVDVALEIFHAGEATPNRRKLKVMGREIEGADLVYEMDGEAEGQPLRYIGTGAEAKRATTQARILEALETERGAERWMTADEVRGLLDDPRPALRTVQTALGALTSGHKVERLAGGVRPGRGQAPDTYARIGFRPSVSVVDKFHHADTAEDGAE